MNGLRPYSSLSLPSTGFKTSSTSAAHIDIRPMVLAVAAASPFLMAKIIGARVGTHIVCAIIMKPEAMAMFLAIRFFCFASASSSPLTFSTGFSVAIVALPTGLSKLNYG
eukprot:CAMPEP_0172811772 /NCGR_PEP_ID=MMETSP1075-20121228/9626_1 /TAXON_ID=2916 /ORGANISM="Ceratium fusus, Strain PA161109" /LENGTH=109 /DNA_ID=CAMNT_0013651241 /DNA_START=35 /DNA_END=364 /DNA_ORIENTATION=-